MKCHVHIPDSWERESDGLSPGPASSPEPAVALETSALAETSTHSTAPEEGVLFVISKMLPPVLSCIRVLTCCLARRGRETVTHMPTIKLTGSIHPKLFTMFLSTEFYLVPVSVNRNCCPVCFSSLLAVPRG